MAALEPSLDLWRSIDSRKKKTAPNQPRGSDVRCIKRPETHDTVYRERLEIRNVRLPTYIIEIKERLSLVWLSLKKRTAQ
jgi:hypothetical protein